MVSWILRVSVRLGRFSTKRFVCKGNESIHFLFGHGLHLAQFLRAAVERLPLVLGSVEGWTPPFCGVRDPLHVIPKNGLPAQKILSAIPKAGSIDVTFAVLSVWVGHSTRCTR